MRFTPVANAADIAPPFDISPHRRLYPYASHWVSGPGFLYHYLDEGRGEPIVAVHGNPTWSFHYREAIGRLRSDYRLIAPDHVGCGLSSRPPEDVFAYTLASHADNLEALLDHLGLLSGVTLLVHDWGGMIGLACACRRPERISRIILLNTGAFLIPAGKKLPWQLSFIHGLPILPDLLVRGLNAFSYLATFLAVTKRMLPDVRRAYRAPYNSWRNRLATLRFVQDIPVSPRDRSHALAKWTDEHLRLLRHLPMLICWGERDFVFDAPILAEWRRRFPEAEVHTFPRGGHYLLEDEGERVIELIREFLIRTSQTR
ncbi:MAG: alpha/beta fold hydrolase [Pseudomonadota bacterium]|nr:alpha/beta fold hydrolase [Pseudomonadota bacterium]